MVASTLVRQSSPTVPQLACSNCGARMNLKTIEPADDGDSMITFGCACGNQYRLSQREFASFACDDSDRW